MKRSLGFVAIGLTALLASTARADYSYVTAIGNPPSNPYNVGFGSHSPQTSTASFASSSGTGLVGNQNIALASVADLTTASFRSTDTGTVNFTIALNLSQFAGDLPDQAGSATITITGFLTFTRSDTKGEASSITVTMISPASVTIGNPALPGAENYTLTTISYAPPTVNAPPGSPSAGTISGFLTVTPVSVPEPASMAMLGVGSLLLVAPRLRRLVRRIAGSAQA